ncbi:ABC transporter permease [Tsukamurella ocularis]|uniref:ABC transporter permease n=1 Tax=Tsukamurella ocularis TaxID=1970234 RepID=UPI00216A8622|nr:ABC transporter permease [Tsukamurella ocularis]MCS3778817.1 phospholipid/cholesterol/gamma-HCH transport system permease protein [Tsukamurella ocularis]MCS3787563.1 phospholipid/cholesterol/gamma-HCH transport system permease protein [Tsukamurella ocularis]MCS3851500.1 phospholipid/cholesterol/gamma-HCH transport system permease protein [Tsukamurella ocularis]
MAAPYVPFRLGRVRTAMGAALGRPVTAFAMLGHQARFVMLALRSVPFAVRTYPKHILSHIGAVVFGNGAIIVGGGMLGVLVFLGVAMGGTIAIQGFSLLDMVNMGPLTGLVAAYATTREMGPLIAAVGFAAQVGCRITAEVGAMRMSEEIDALDASAIRPIPFVVTTRVIAGVVAIVPLYLLTLIAGYLTCELMVSVVHGQSSGTYGHYFSSFISPQDMGYSLVKAVVFAVAVILIHSYQGYYASGGPEGVGVAAGRAIRASLVIVVSLDMVMTLLFWGFDSGVRITG